MMMKDRKMIMWFQTNRTFARLFPAISGDTWVDQSEAEGGGALDFLENKTDVLFFYFAKVCRDAAGKQTAIKILSNS